ncbi:MAG: hypothetical protein WDN66_03305 [Candidatus Saccharibacteria bacterium]
MGGASEGVSTSQGFIEGSSSTSGSKGKDVIREVFVYSDSDSSSSSDSDRTERPLTPLATKTLSPVTLDHLAKTLQEESMKLNAEIAAAGPNLTSEQMAEFDFKKDLIQAKAVQLKNLYDGPMLPPAPSQGVVPLQAPKSLPSAGLGSGSGDQLSKETANIMGKGFKRLFKDHRS